MRVHQNRQHPPAPLAAFFDATFGLVVMLWVNGVAIANFIKFPPSWRFFTRDMMTISGLNLTRLKMADYVYFYSHIKN